MSSMTNLTATIEALLFSESAPMTLGELATATKESSQALTEALSRLKKRYEKDESGLQLVQSGNKVALATTSELSEFLTKYHKQENQKELSPATLETIAIVLYCHPVSRATIDHIRGVNSQYTLRHLLMRGFIETTHHKNSNEHLYRPTIDLLLYLGLEDTTSLPDHQEIIKALADYYAQTNGHAE